MKFSAIVSRVFLSLAFLTASVASATPLTWTFQGVTFDDDASLSGYLEVESTTGDLLSWNLTTSAGVLAGFTYDSSTSTLYARDLYAPNGYLITSNDVNNSTLISLNFASALTAPGSVNLVISDVDLSGGFECDNCFTTRFINAGAISTQVPEPAPLALFGVALIALAARRKLQK
ncbi:PEP-CTERM sorting domain-containing protein [Massilia sp. CF038]|uniref:PEP-CTERM sorting domain-containing protein n=1 Tax=Massilia sp. CF038 TaxID=1881045 RepID=UPI000918FE22|nr:PEP-CTERM sorting domain-containing protein [Massilia sp. CF038]SHH66271.1 PEP-CTERM protein-sorting domain-containing protein [Massilia sp. CF038]